MIKALFLKCRIGYKEPKCLDGKYCDICLCNKDGYCDRYKFIVSKYGICNHFIDRNYQGKRTGYTKDELEVGKMFIERVFGQLTEFMDTTHRKCKRKGK